MPDTLAIARAKSLLTWYWTNHELVPTNKGVKPTADDLEMAATDIIADLTHWVEEQGHDMLALCNAAIDSAETEREESDGGHI